MRSNARRVIQRIAARLNRVRNEAPRILANTGQQHFNKNFRDQSFQGNKWPEVQRRMPGTFAYTYPKNKFTSRRTNPILVGKTRRLMRAVNRAVKSANINRIVWGVSGGEGKYGYYHNYGIGQKQRSFMRSDRVLRKKLKEKYYQLFRRTR